MQRLGKLSVALAVGLCGLPQGISQAQTQNAPPPSSGPQRDPEAMSALEKMGKYLRSLNTFQVKAVGTREQVVKDGEKVQYGGTIDLLAQRPGKLRVEINTDRENRTFYYDGKTFTMYAPRQNLYTTVPAPATINELAAQLEDKYDLELPLIDLFRWGTSEAKAEEITVATDVGPAQIDGTTTEHYAFRQKGVDWQIWIQNGEYPLPRKLVITTTTDEARPQYVAEYTWNLAPSFNDEAFAFEAPKDAKKIPLAEVTPMAGVNRKQEVKK